MWHKSKKKVIWYYIMRCKLKMSERDDEFRVWCHNCIYLYTISVIWSAVAGKEDQ